MTSRILICFFHVGIAVGVAPDRAYPGESRPNGPNIVLFLADDLGWADVPWHGSAYRMPHLERLAQGGVRLEAHYVHPMCSPTRAALLTGRYASRFGVTGAQNERALPFGTPTLASLLQAAGYDTAIVGKWHLGSKPEWGPNRFGFQHSYGLLAGGCGPYDHRYKTGPYTRTWHRNGHLIEEEGHVTDLITREAVRWLDQRGSKPFFLYVAFTAIHIPIDEPEKWRQANADLGDPGARLRAATASHMDDAIGRVLEALERKGLRNNTLVVFLSDNGAHPATRNDDPLYPGKHPSHRVGNDNLPLRGHKGGVYEGGIRTPGIVHWPGKLQPGEVHAPLHAVDWMPTLCGLAGVRPAGDRKWDGIEIWPVLRQPKNAWPARTVYSAAPGFRAQMVRHGDWKLVVTKPGGKKRATEELFHLADDLGEKKDLAAGNPDVLSEMKKRLAEAAAHDRDAVPRD